MEYPRHLTFQQLELLVATETKTDFGYTSSLSKDDDLLDVQVESTWNDAILYEWTMALNGETSSQKQKYPYILCHNGENMSGYERRLALTSTIKSIQQDSEGRSKIFLRTLYNKDDSFCVFGHLYASVAINIVGDEYVVQPVLPSLKMIKGSVDVMKEEISDVLSDSGTSNTVDNTADNYRKITIDMDLCPGVDVDKNGSSFQEAEEDLEGMRMGDIMEAITNMLLSVDAKSLTVTSSSSSSFLPLSQQVYLTSEAYIGQTTSSRAEMWSNLLHDYQVSGRCDETYKTGLKWNGSQTARPDLFPSHMQVEYSNSGEMETALGCALVLLLAITANRDVCSVEVQRSVKTHNLIANYLTESGIEDVTPFQEEGIDGTGEVVAISDSGVDIDNCYFYDPNTNKNGTVGSPTGPGPLVDLSFRKVVQYVAHADTGDYNNGHGTHVAGTIAGKRFDGEEGAADGIASGAKLAVLDAGRGTACCIIPSNVLDTGAPHAKIHSASWGSYTRGQYISRDRIFDQFMYEVRFTIVSFC